MPTALAPARSIEFAALAGGQSRFVADGGRYPGLFGGIGGGKTFATCLKAYLYVHANPGARLLISEPTYRMIRDVLLPKWETMFGSIGGYHLSIADMSIQFSNGSQILLRPADVTERLRGLELAAWGMDEAAIGDQELAFRILLGRLRQPGMPHQGWVTTTPRGLNWLWRTWVKEPLAGAGAHYARTEENPYLPPEFVHELRRAYGATPFAAQELEGRFVQYEGLAFPMFSPALHVRPLPDSPLTRVVGGLDFGVISPTCLLRLGRDPAGRVWAQELLYRRHCTEAELVEAVSEAQLPLLVADPSGKTVIEALRRLGLSVSPARSNDFGLRARLVSARLTPGPDGLPGLYVTPDSPNLITELMGLAYHKPRGLEMLTERWAPGLDDHAYDALAYALMEIEHWQRPQFPKWHLKAR